MICLKLLIHRANYIHLWEETSRSPRLQRCNSARFPLTSIMKLFEPAPQRASLLRRSESWKRRLAQERTRRGPTRTIIQIILSPTRNDHHPWNSPISTSIVTFFQLQGRLWVYAPNTRNVTAPTASQEATFQQLKDPSTKSLTNSEKSRGKKFSLTPTKMMMALEHQ